jgi:hypothetical protein
MIDCVKVCPFSYDGPDAAVIITNPALKYRTLLAQAA